MHVNGLDIRKIPVPFQRSGWKYYRGVEGIGGYTVHRDSDGWFHSFFCKRAGKNARNKSKSPEYYIYVPRLSSKRRGKKAVMVRSRNLAYGHDFEETEAPLEEPKRSANAPGTGFCTKQRKTVYVDFNEAIEAKNGRTMIRGTCPECNTYVQVYGVLVECGNCGKTRQGKTNDYLCAWCRLIADG